MPSPTQESTCLRLVGCRSGSDPKPGLTQVPLASHKLQRTECAGNLCRAWVASWQRCLGGAHGPLRTARDQAGRRRGRDPCSSAVH